MKRSHVWFSVICGSVGGYWHGIHARDWREMFASLAIGVFALVGFAASRIPASKERPGA